MLTCEHLTKRFGNLTAVNDVSLEIRAGESFGLLGPNGAGKTTTISMICGLLRPDQGRVLVGGEPVASDTSPAKRRIGYVPQDLAVYEELTARANLTLFGSLYGLSGAALEARIKAALETVALGDRVDGIVGKFSGGMKRRLNIAGALLHDPNLLVLDEPTVGVDPQSRNAIFDTLKALQATGKTLLYTTHYMEEVERLCDRVAIMDHGKLVAQDTLAGLRGLMPATQQLTLDYRSANGTVVPDLLAGVPDVRVASAREGGVDLVVEQLGRDVPAILARLASANITVTGLASKQAALEDVFLHLTGRTLRD